MADLESSDKGTYEQFEKCVYSDKNCMYYNLDEGRCIWEACVFKLELPKHVEMWSTTCQICNKRFKRNPKHMKWQVCDRCLQRMQKAEDARHAECVMCGKRVVESKMMFSSLCNSCINELNLARLWKHLH